MKHALMLVFLLFTVAGNSLFASSDSLKTERKKRNEDFPRATIKFNPTCLANGLRPSLYFSSDIWIVKHFALELGAGWFFNTVNHGYKGEKQNGFRGRFALKYLILEHPIAKPFIAVEAKYNYIKENHTQLVCRYGCQYEQALDVNSVMNTYGAALKGGLQLNLGKRHRFVLEPYVGLGFKMTKLQRDMPQDATEITGRHPDFTNFNRAAGTYWLPDMLLGLNVGYAFRRKAGK